MRVKGERERIDYKQVGAFFENRAKKYKEDTPYTVTMYQDNNPDLVDKRNKQEVEIILPKLELNSSSTILDVGCGIGRWSDAVDTEIKEYCGVDFSADLIRIAKERSKLKKNRDWRVGSAKDIEAICKGEKYSHIMVMGVMMYLNDDDVIQMLKGIGELCEESSVIALREPIGIDERLTLKEHFSEDLEDTYNAIYRTREEILDYCKETIMRKGFKAAEMGYLFDKSLNNRKETCQYFFVFKR